MINGSSVLLCHGDELVDVVRRGQGVLNVLPLASVKTEVDAAIELRPAPTAEAPRTAASGS